MPFAFFAFFAFFPFIALFSIVCCHTYTLTIHMYIYTVRQSCVVKCFDISTFRCFLFHGTLLLCDIRASACQPFFDVSERDFISTLQAAVLHLNHECKCGVRQRLEVFYFLYFDILQPVCMFVCVQIYFLVIELLTRHCCLILYVASSVANEFSQFSPLSMDCCLLM